MIRICLLVAAALLAGLAAATAQVPTNAAANLVLGQSLFTTNTSASPATATSLATPNGIAVDPVSGKVFVADSANNRVLRYASQAALANGAIPEIVIGQVNFSSSLPNQTNTATPSQTSLANPSDVFVDAAGRLWIADTDNSRVLLFENAANLFNTPSADRVYGQPDFTTSAADTTQSKLANPRGLCVDPNGVLWVADTGGHRVVAWKNAATLANGALADRVLGQTTFTSTTAGISQTKFTNPRGIVADASQVWVADSDNNRVVMFANFPAINGAPANLVLGQKDYVSNSPATSSTGMTAPTSAALDGTTLYVADSGNNRVLRFANATALANGGAAAGVIGQAGFTTGTSGLSAQRIALFHSHISTDATGNLFVADTLNNRALRFATVVPVPPTPTPTPTARPVLRINGPRQVTTSKEFHTVRGTARAQGGLLRVSYDQNDEGFLLARGKAKWTARLELVRGRNRVVFYAVDRAGKLSKPQTIVIFRR